MKKLEEKVAIVTGASDGMGLETAKLFLKEGAKVVLTGRNQEKLDALAPALEGDYLLVKADASSIVDSTKLIEKTINTFGRLDILFLNAGILRMEPIENLNEDVFDEIYDVNLKGPLFTIKAAFPHLKTGASIIFNTSTSNVKGYPAMTAYSSSKAALRSATRTLAAEFGSKGIRVNAVSPGPIDTAIFDKSNLPKEQVDQMTASFPSMVTLGRFGESSEVANVVLFLASAESSYITGAEIPVDGGFAQT